MGRILKSRRKTVLVRTLTVFMWILLQAKSKTKHKTNEQTEKAFLRLDKSIADKLSAVGF